MEIPVLIISIADALYVDKTIAAGGNINGTGLVVIVIDPYRAAFEFFNGLMIRCRMCDRRNVMTISGCSR